MSGSLEELLSQRDLPLWARAVVGGLLVVTSWWSLSAEGIRGFAGSSVGVVVLGIVAASSLRGMHLPLGLWPDGPWRKQMSLSSVVVVSIVFGGLMVVAAPRAPNVLSLIDPGAFGLVVVGVVVWGFTWSLVVQRGFAGWYAIATVVGLAPFFTGLLTQGLGSPQGLCILAPHPEASCDGAALRVLGFLAPAYAAAALVTIELAFRRLLIGAPRRATVATIGASALLFAGWTALVGPDAPLVAIPWWLALCGALSAGCLYALGGSLLISGLYTGLLYGSFMGLMAAQPVGAPEGIGGPYIVMTVLVALGMVALVVQQRGPWRIPGIVRS